MKKLLLIAAIGLMSFTTQEPKTYTITLTAEETQIVFAALGELPAKTTEGIRAKIAQQVTEQNKHNSKNNKYAAFIFNRTLFRTTYSACA